MDLDIICMKIRQLKYVSDGIVSECVHRWLMFFRDICSDIN